jgi:hypothetical protein
MPGLRRFIFAELGEAFANGLLGFFADGAGVEKDEVGLFLIFRGAEAGGLQDGSNDFAVAEIHRAAVALYIKMALIVVGVCRKRSKGFALPRLIMHFGDNI